MAQITNNNYKLCDTLLLQRINQLNNAVLQNPKISKTDIEDIYKKSINYKKNRYYMSFFQNKWNASFIYSVVFVFVIIFSTPLLYDILEYIIGMRCIVPNNYLIWEATRPVSDCNFCKNINKPIILQNLTKDEFVPYAYTSQPIIIKNAVNHWPAVTLLNYTYLKDLYIRTPGALESVKEDCQFLHFKSNFISLADVFKMSSERAEFRNGQLPWYVGWYVSILKL